MTQKYVKRNQIAYQWNASVYIFSLGQFTSNIFNIYFQRLLLLLYLVFTLGVVGICLIKLNYYVFKSDSEIFFLNINYLDVPALEGKTRSWVPLLNTQCFETKPENRQQSEIKKSPESLLRSVMLLSEISKKVES